MLVRTAENKYWRGDVSDADELIDGFPKTREELFAYKAIILGSVEAASFSDEQLRMLADFVSKRGGGLLMLGGRRAFSEGGWAGTPVAEVLPVEFDSSAPAAERPARGHAPVGPADARRRHLSGHPARRHRGQVEREVGRHADRHERQPVRRVKPGATPLLTATDDDRQEQVVLAYQRYGRGKAVAFPIQDSWIWKMDADDRGRGHDARHVLAADDPLAGGRRARSGVDDDDARSRRAGRAVQADRRGDGSGVRRSERRARVRDRSRRRPARRRKCRSSGPSTHDGEYTGTFVPDEVGLYKVKTTATRDETELGDQH